MLHKLGYKTVLEAASVVEAENLVAKHSKTNSGMTGLLGNTAPSHLCDIGLMIIDCDLKPECGTKYLKALRQKYPANQLPVLLIAGNSHSEKLKEASEIGANETLSIPFTQDQLKIKTNVLLTSVSAPVIASFNFNKPAKKAEKKEEKKISPPKAPEEIVRKVSKAQAAKASGGSDRSSFYGGQKTVTYSTDDEPTATLIDGKIDGHYHEKVAIIGGGVNCFWAKQIEGDERVRLEYISPKGRPTGMEAKIIPVEQFMHTFYLCQEHGCQILSALAEGEG